MRLSDDLGYISFEPSVHLRFFTEKIPCCLVIIHYDDVLSKEIERIYWSYSKAINSRASKV